MLASLPPHPLKRLYDKSALDLALQSFEALPTEHTNEVVAWIQTAAANLPPDKMREPSVNIPLFEGHIVSLLRLAVGCPNMKEYAPDWDPAEAEEVAALMVSASLTRRARGSAATPAATSDDGAAAAERHHWKVLEDAVGELKDYEDKIVELGEAALSGQPSLLEQWREDTDDGTFADAADDVRRRLDFVAANKAPFEGSKVNAALLQEGEALHRDALAFFKGREGTSAPKEKLTLARDQAFTLLLNRLDRLQLILRAAYRDDADARKKIDGGYWRRLQRLSRPRRKRKTG